MERRPGYSFMFACQRSGNCCARPEGVVRVSSEDVRRIATHLELPEAGVRSRYLASSGDRLAEGMGNRCVFLEDGGEATCGIYPARPERCRTWPFWPELAEPGEELKAACRVCPGIVPDRRDD